MVLLYSGAEKHGAIQQQPFSSLGGYVSSTAIRNNFKNGVFSDISLNDIKDKKSSCRLIVLQNTLGVEKTDVKIWIDTNPKQITPIAQYSGALVLPSLDDHGFPIFEKIFAETDTPFNGVFQDVEGNINKLQIESIMPNTFIGIWLKRDINTSNTNYFNVYGDWCLDTNQMLIDAAADATHFYNNKSEAFSLKVEYS